MKLLRCRHKNGKMIKKFQTLYKIIINWSSDKQEKAFKKTGFRTLERVATELQFKRWRIESKTPIKLTLTGMWDENNGIYFSIIPTHNCISYRKIKNMDDYEIGINIYEIGINIQEPYTILNNVPKLIENILSLKERN